MLGGYMPGAGQSAPVSHRPAGAVGGGDFIAPNPRRQVLAKVNSAGTTRTSVAVAARIVNPAARLVCSFSISFEPAVPQDFSNYNSATWTARVLRAGAEGREAALHLLFEGEALPEMYEISSAARLILVTATLTIPLTAGAVAIPGTWVCEAQWEPAMPMCEAEVAALYSQTGLFLALRPAGDLAP